MAIDARIPLQARTADLRPSLNTLVTLQGQKQDRAQRQQQLNIQRTRADSQNELAGLEKTKVLQEIAKNKKVDQMNQAASDFLQIQNSIDAGDLEGAVLLTTNRLDRLNNQAKEDQTITTTQTEQLLNAFANNPQQAAALVQGQVDQFEKLGVLKRDPKGGLASAVTKVFKNGTVLQALPGGDTQVRNQRNQIVTGDDRVKTLQDAYAAENEKLLSRAEINQMQDIAQFKIKQQESSQKGQLEITNLLKSIESAELKIADTKENKAKASQIKGMTLDVLNELKSNPDGVRALVGPFDQSVFSGPEILPSTLKARTQHERLKALLTVDNLKLMTGILTDTDVLLLGRIAGGGLDINGDDDAYLSEVDRLIETLSSEVSSGFTAEEEAELKELERLEAEGKL